MRARPTRVIAAVWLALATGTAGAAELAVTLTDVQDAPGRLRVVLYDEAGFLDESRALAIRSLAPSAPERTVRFADLPPGRYAVLAYHDADADGTLDRFLGMIPSEGWGMSNNPRLFGKPRFEQAAVTLQGKARRSIGIRLDY